MKSLPDNFVLDPETIQEHRYDKQWRQAKTIVKQHEREEKGQMEVRDTPKGPDPRWAGLELPV